MTADDPGAEMIEPTRAHGMTDPWFAPSERGALRDFWDVYDANYDVVLAETLRAAGEHPELKNVLDRVLADPLAAQNAGGRELVRRAVAGDWSTYEAHLRQRGKALAELGVGFAAWRAATTAFTRGLTPFLVRAYVDAPDRLAAALVAMQTFVDAVSTTIGTEYLETKEGARKHAERELRLREARFRALIEKSSDLISLTAADGTILYMSPGVERVLGRKDVDVVGKTFNEFFHPDDGDRVHQVLGLVLQDPTKSQTVSFRVVHADGSIRWLEATATNLIADPAVGAIVGNCRDITDRKLAEDALRDSEARFKRLWTSGIVGIMIASPSGLVTEANDAFLAMVGYSRDDLANGSVNWSEMTPIDARDVNRAIGEQLRTLGIARPWEKEYVRKDGSRIPVLVGVATLEGSRVISLTLDLTERTRAVAALRATEEQLRQMQKLDAIGSLAGGVAHDFNNMLSVILGYTGILLTELSPDDVHRADIVEVQAAAQRGAALTQQLLAFSRQQVLQPQVLDLNPILVGMENMLRRLVSEAIELSVHPDPTLGRVKADPGQMEQVIMNLVVNARDAMPRGGKLRIETRNVALDEGEAAGHHGLVAGPYVMLAVTDTGVGMDAATRARIFEPFFTTKERGKGTGLGLATVFGIVRQSEGHVWVYSEPGLGSTFKIYLPRTRDAGVAARSQAPTARDLRGTETVLLVEDEEQVRTVAKTILRRSGYHVLEAQNGADALLACERHVGKIHLVLTDVVMPQMSGRALSERVASLRPDAKVLFMSGYTDDAIVHHGVLDGGVAFLQKPLTPDALLRKVREVLDTQ